MTQENIKYLKDQEQLEDSKERMNKYMGGTMIIVMGVAFLLATNFGFAIGQLWPLFFLFPAFYSVGHIIQDVRHGRDVNLSFVLGLLTMVFIASVWIFNWNWGTIWPVFMIIGGLYAFSNNSHKK